MALLIKKPLTFKQKRERLGYKRDPRTGRLTNPIIEKQKKEINSIERDKQQWLSQEDMTADEKNEWIEEYTKHLNNTIENHKSKLDDLDKKRKINLRKRLDRHLIEIVDSKLVSLNPKMSVKNLRAFFLEQIIIELKKTNPGNTLEIKKIKKDIETQFNKELRRKVISSKLYKLTDKDIYDYILEIFKRIKYRYLKDK